MPEERKELTLKEHFNIAHALCVVHQRAIVVLSRDKWGKNALGFTCAFAFALQFAWAAFSQDTLMYLWLGIWCLCYAKRRGEAVKLAGRVHSYYDGWPCDAVRYCGSERIAKRVVEPILVGILGGILRWYYTQQGWSPMGLPNFLLLGVLTLPFVEAVNQKVRERRIDAMSDARMEQEQLVQDYRDRFGS
jgi:hypothetical protein